MDDTNVMKSLQFVNKFLGYLNGVNNSIKFREEHETADKPGFLGCRLNRVISGQLNLNIPVRSLF